MVACVDPLPSTKKDIELSMSVNLEDLSRGREEDQGLHPVVKMAEEILQL